MLGRTYEGQTCSVARALELVGERWSLLILRDALFGGFTRFSEFQSSLEIAPNILSRRLESFVAAGLMRAEPSVRRGDHKTYHLTEKGRDLKPVVIALTLWGDRWIGPGPMVFAHEPCGGAVQQPLVCRTCGQALDPKHVMAKPRGHRRRRGGPRKSTEPAKGA